MVQRNNTRWIGVGLRAKKKKVPQVRPRRKGTKKEKERKKSIGLTYNVPSRILTDTLGMDWGKKRD